MRTIKTEAKRGTSDYIPGRFVSLKELYEEYDKCVPGTEPMAPDACSVYLEEFVNRRETFRVSSLQHVTTAECAELILQSQRFIVKGDLSSHRKSANKSWWSAVAPEGDFRSWQSGNLEKCFSASPAFKPDVSRYGNFKFSFPLAELISAYKKQYCGGGEPKIRVFETKMFKYEMSHVVLIHSPDTDCLFDDLPLVPSVKRQPDLPTDLPTDLPQSDLPTNLPQSELPYINPVVYDKESHEIIWSPESKATSLRIQNNLGTWNKTYKCPWNHLEVVFHLPKAEGLHLPLHNLLGHLSTCDTICYLQRPDTQKSKAEADSILESLKKKYTKAITESSTEINRRPLTERSLNCMRDLEGERGGKRKEKKHHTGESKKLKRF